MTQMHLFDTRNRENILLELFQAYFDARKNKRNTLNALAFEKILKRTCSGSMKN
jgi:hypothetical protein